MLATGSGGFKFITGTSFITIGVDGSNYCISLGDSSLLICIAEVLHSELVGVVDKVGFNVIYKIF
jgi:hypothetical protein